VDETLNLSKLTTFILSNVHTLLFLIGLGVFVYATFCINQTAGLFALSIALIVVAILSDGKSSGGR
jgi:hypothetical protein